MPLIKPFAGLRPVPERAAEVIAPPYDVLSSAEARVRAAGRPWSFLHISRAEIDLPEDVDPHDPAVYAKSSENMRGMLREGVLIREAAPSYYVYRMIMDGRAQVGLVAVASLADYETNRIRRHELTRPSKEDDRVRQIEALNAQTGPVLMAYRSQAGIDSILAAAAGQPPLVDVTADDGVQHAFWKLDDESLMERITSAFDRMDALYIADGHHRSAAASRVARNRAAGEATGERSSDYFLTVIFPHDQLRILDYNRVITDLNGLASEQLLERARGSFTVTGESAAVRPRRAAEFGMYVDGRWYRLAIHPERIPADPVASLDVSLLADNLIEPVLGIADQRTDSRIDFIGGVRGLAELQRRVDSGEMAVAFSFFPTGMEALMAVADAGAVMPPKSTWFEPKLADGLISHVLD